MVAQDAYADRATQKRKRNAEFNKPSSNAGPRNTGQRENSHPSTQSKNPLTNTATYEFKLDQAGRPRPWTLSLAIASSILDNVQTPDLKSYLVGQIARAIVIFKVDEVIVFREDSDVKSRRSLPHHGGHVTDSHSGQQKQQQQQQETFTPASSKSFDAQKFMVHLMEYLETPQYLRRTLFPVHNNLKYAGLLNPIDAPHHCRKGEKSMYREGLVMADAAPRGMRLVNCGLEAYCCVPVKQEEWSNIKPGMRVTVRFDQVALTQMDHQSGGFGGTGPNYKKPRRDNSRVHGELVSPSEPRERHGIYWGYTVRQAESLSQVFTQCPFEGGYDMTIGTSERGKPIDQVTEHLPQQFKHGLIVFGGVHGIEACVDGDVGLTSIAPEEADKLFDFWVNTCPEQGSRTIRTEEAILITLSALRAPLEQRGQKV